MIVVHAVSVVLEVATAYAWPQRLSLETTRASRTGYRRHSHLLCRLLRRASNRRLRPLLLDGVDEVFKRRKNPKLAKGFGGH
jgi:hypothetical protein